MEEIERHSLQLAKQWFEAEGQTKSGLILQHLNEKKCTVSLPKIPVEHQWINVPQSFSADDLLGKIVLLDFFTYCCINCIHMFPFIHKLELKHSVEDGFVVVGIHSAKFPNEKDAANIKHALHRYDILHPVLNDSNIEMWNSMQVSCWPTLIVLGPENEVLLSLPGEVYVSFVEAFIDEAMTFYASKLSNHSLPHDTPDSEVDSATTTATQTELSFPTKIAINKDDTLAIADTGNNRIILCNQNGEIVHIVGTGVAGREDGDFSKAQFNAPHGLTWNTSNSLFVADCENHLIRKIDMTVHRVVTIAGTGAQCNDLEGGKLGTDQGISSPWDVQIAGSPRFADKENILYIAMPGIHQIWAFFLKDADWQQNTEYEMMTCLRLAGSGQEENRNNSYPHKAGFAQPSGITVDTANHKMYVADSESSTIRKIDLSNGAVEAVVGGHFDPTNLFAFGDVDGKARNVKLQHPLGVAWDHKRARLFVADSYNHKIKMVDPSKKTCMTIIGPTANDLAEKSDLDLGEFPAIELNEPGGLALDSSCDLLYVADTNNHRILVVSLSRGNIEELILNGNSVYVDLAAASDKKEVAFQRLVGLKRAFAKTFPAREVSPHQTLSIHFHVSDLKLTDQAPSSWQMSLHNESLQAVLLESGSFAEKSAAFEFRVPVKNLLTNLVTMQDGANVTGGEPERVSAVLSVEANLYYCLDNAELCSLKGVVCDIPLHIYPHEGNDIVNMTVQLKKTEILAK